MPARSSYSARKLRRRSTLLSSSHSAFENESCYERFKYFERRRARQIWALKQLSHSYFDYAVTVSCVAHGIVALLTEIFGYYLKKEDVQIGSRVPGIMCNVLMVLILLFLQFYNALEILAYRDYSRRIILQVSAPLTLMVFSFAAIAMPKLDGDPLIFLARMFYAYLRAKMAIEAIQKANRQNSYMNATDRGEF